MKNNNFADFDTKDLGMYFKVTTKYLEIYYKTWKKIPEFFQSGKLETLFLIWMNVIFSDMVKCICAEYGG